MNGLRIEEYRPSDRSDCLAVFDSNVPRFFGGHERDELASFLDGPSGVYLVVRRESSTVACGGVARVGEDAVLCWGMVHADHHRQGLGRALRDHRLAITRRWGVRRVRIETSQRTEAFFAPAGFVVTERERDGFGAGLDRVTMVLVA